MLTHLTRSVVVCVAVASMMGLAGCSRDTLGSPQWNLGGPKETKGVPIPVGYGTSPRGVSGDVVVVRSGDTLASLAQRHDVAIADLMAANGLRDGSIVRGQILLLPSAR